MKAIKFWNVRDWAIIAVSVLYVVGITYMIINFGI